MEYNGYSYAAKGDDFLAERVLVDSRKGNLVNCVMELCKKLESRFLRALGDLEDLVGTLSAAST